MSLPSSTTPPRAPADAAALPNVVILTHGWSGSSAYSALFGRAGYWLGDQTMVKPDYDTFENAELVDVNRTILRELAPSLNHEHRFSAQDVDDIAAQSGKFSAQELRRFVALCNSHSPWLWKDPRLTWTMRVWAPFLEPERTRFVVLTRDPLQAWASANLRRHVQSYRFTRAYNDGITASNLRFLAERVLPVLTLSFEDLLLRPDDTLARLGEHVGLPLSSADLQAVCQLPLRRKSRNWRDYAVAGLIYLKNFSERDGRGRLSPSPPLPAGSRQAGP